MVRDNFNIKKEIYRKLAKVMSKLNDSLINHPLFDEIVTQVKYFFINQGCTCDFKVINDGLGLEIYGISKSNTLNLKKHFTAYRKVELIIEPRTKDLICRDSYGELLDYETVVKRKNLDKTIINNSDSKKNYSIFNNRYVCSLNDNNGIELKRCIYTEDSKVFESSFENLDLLISEMKNSKPIFKNLEIRPSINVGGFRYKMFTRDIDNINLIKKEDKECKLVNNSIFINNSKTTYHINAFYNPRRIEIRNPNSYLAKEIEGIFFNENDEEINFKKLDQEVAENFINRKGLFLEKRDQVLVSYLERTKEKYNIKLYKHKAIKKER